MKERVSKGKVVVQEQVVAGTLAVQIGDDALFYYLLKPAPVSTWDFSGKTVGLVFYAVPAEPLDAFDDENDYYESARNIVVGTGTPFVVEYATDKDTILTEKYENK